MIRKPKKIESRRVTSASRDDLLCQFGPDAFSVIAPAILAHIHEQPFAIAADYLAEVVARLALVLVCTSSVLRGDTARLVLRCRFWHLSETDHGCLWLPVEQACVPFEIEPVTSAWCAAYRLVALRGHGYGRNQLGYFQETDFIVSEPEQRGIANSTATRIKLILQQACAGRLPRIPTFGQLAALAQSSAAQSQSAGAFAAAYGSGLSGMNPAVYFPTSQEITGDDQFCFTTR